MPPNAECSLAILPSPSKFELKQRIAHIASPASSGQALQALQGILTLGKTPQIALTAEIAGACSVAMATCTVSLSIGPIGVACAIAERHCSRQILRSARFASSPRIGSSRNWRPGSWRPEVRAQAGDGGALRPGKGSLQQSTDGDGVSLGTALLPPDADLGKLESLLFQWGNSLTANANLPLPNPLKVDKVKGGVRLGYVRIKDGSIEDLVHIDVIVNPATADQQAYFQATRNGQYKDQVPPGEPVIMQSLLQALRTAIRLARE